ncbi:MAG: hypothetical protein M3R62_03720, partial [Acidobacteriota bacterium]|nr:hypothetical protein [Acidobacteriota bacterium]
MLPLRAWYVWPCDPRGAALSGDLPEGVPAISDPITALTLPESGLTEFFGIADENLRAIEDAFGV